MSDNAVKVAKIIVNGAVFVGTVAIVCGFGSEVEYVFPDNAKIIFNPSTVFKKKETLDGAERQEVGQKQAATETTAKVKDSSATKQQPEAGNNSQK